MEPRSGGEAAPGAAFHYQLPVEVRFRDTDAMGHVNNAVYLTYLEAARAGYYRAVTGRSFEGIGEEPVSIILARALVDFRAQAYFGERLLVACRASWVGRSSFALSYRITAAPDSPRGAGRLGAMKFWWRRSRSWRRRRERPRR